jgi:transcriptional regulator GlxA family with amidase domain
MAGIKDHMLKPVPAPTPQAAHPRLIGFLFVPRFSMIAFTSAVEPLRLANQISGQRLYEWRLFSRDGAPIRASNDVEITVHGAFADARNLNAAVVCSGLDVQTFDHREIMAALRRLSSFGSEIGAVCTGTYVLAKAGLLDGHRSTIHWENHAGLIAEFPRLAVSADLFQIDRKRFTCAGGTAALDMMLAVITRDYGHAIAAQVTDQMIHHRIREAGEQQRMDLRARLGVAHPKLLTAVSCMERTIEKPLSCDELALAVKLSKRQLERLFRKYLNHSPTKHYQMIRLERARYLLRQTSMPVISIAIACGYESNSYFSKSYSDHFGCTPSMERTQPRHARADPAAPEILRGTG